MPQTLRRTVSCRLLSCLLLGALLSLLPPILLPARAQSWDAASGYSIAENPSGAWAFGRKWSVETTAFDVMTARWGDSGWFLGNWGHGGPSFYAGPHLWAKNNTNGYPAARWTSPASGYYRITGRFVGDDNLTFVTLSGATLFADHVRSDANVAEFGLEAVYVPAGAAVDFVVVWAGDGSSEAGWTLLEATITGLNCHATGEGCIERIVPASGGNAGEVTVRVVGNGFEPGASVALRAGSIGLDALKSTVGEGGTSVEATFDLSGQTPGVYDVVVGNPEQPQVALSGGFVITAGGDPIIDLGIVGRSVVRAGRPERYFVTYTNRGNVDAIGVPLWITGFPRGASITILSDLEVPDVDGFESGSLPLTYDLGTELVVPLLVPWLAPGEERVVAMQVTLPVGAPPFRLRAVTLPSSGFLAAVSAFRARVLAAGGLEQQLTAIVRCAIEGLKVIGGIVGAPCLGVVQEIASVLLHRREQRSRSLMGQGWFYAKIVGSCALNFLPTQKVAAVIDLMVYVTKFVLKVDGAAGGLAECRDAFGTPPDLRSREVELAVQQVAAIDPNDKSGTTGVGRERFVDGRAPITYAIAFENLPTATAAAQEVVIVDQLDAAQVDLESVLFDGMLVGDRHIDATARQTALNAVIDLRPATDLMVRINAGVDPKSGLLRCVLQSVDPVTQLPPDDPTLGFLPPNEVPPAGEGMVLFRARPKADLEHGAVIRNRAGIVFDANPPIETPEWHNTLDKRAPTSSMEPLAPFQNGIEISLRWSAVDDGSGVGDFDLFVSKDGEPFQRWKAGTQDVSATYTGVAGSEYGFYTVARDKVGNEEPTKDVADVVTRLPLQSTSTTTVTAATTTSTVPCPRNPRCALEASRSGACAGTNVPKRIVKSLERAAQLLEGAAAPSSRGVSRLRAKARRTLRSAAKYVRAASRGRPPRLSTDCADAIVSAIQAQKRELRSP